MKPVALAFSRMIRRYGTTFTHAPAGGGSNIIKASFVDPSNQDIPVLQSLGLEARVMRTDAENEISKYEKLTAPDGSIYSVAAAHAVWVGDCQVGQRLYVTS